MNKEKIFTLFWSNGTSEVVKGKNFYNATRDKNLLGLDFYTNDDQCDKWEHIDKKHDWVKKVVKEEKKEEAVLA